MARCLARVPLGAASRSGRRRPGRAALPAAGFRERAPSSRLPPRPPARAHASCNIWMSRCSPAASGSATWLVYKRRSRKGLMALSIFSLLYFGFWRKGCVCAIGSLQNVALGALRPRVCRAGRGDWRSSCCRWSSPCSPGGPSAPAVCPHGALQDLVLLKPVKLPAWLEQA